MALSDDLVSQFVKITKDDQDTKQDSSVYGTVVNYNGSMYVKIDGSDQLTPVSTTADMEEGERVTVTIKDHTATVTGNMSSPAARTDTVQELGTKISEFEIVVADKVSAKDFDAEKARIDDLVAKDATIKGELDAAQATITELQAEDVTIKGRLDANEAAISNLDTQYANIDFSNISEATMESFYANSGLIKDVTIGDATITGELVGVTIKGDLIEGGTVVADKLVIKGEDGLYYKLNTDGVTTEAEQTDYNSLNGSVITAKSITATKISVSDLVAFDATIGGFKITDNSLYSGVKESVGNTTRGIYIDNTGQIAFGDTNNFVKFYKDTDGTYKLTISAESITFGTSGKNVEEEITSVQSEVNTLKDEITTNLCIESSRGTVFKNDTVATVLSVVIYHGSQRITDSDTMKSVFGSGAYLQWKWQKVDEDTFGIISSSDTRFGDNGFTFTLSPNDVDTKVTFMCELIV